MFMFQKLVYGICWLFIRTLEWLRGWPQGGARELPDGYSKVYLPVKMIAAADLLEGGGSWSTLEAVGIVRLPDDYAWYHLRPVALPPGWSLKRSSEKCDVLIDPFERARAQIDYTNQEPVKKLSGSSSLTLLWRFYTDIEFVSDNRVVARVVDRDTGEVLWRTCEWLRYFKRDQETAAGCCDEYADAARFQARERLDRTLPGWRNANTERPYGPPMTKSDCLLW